MITCTRRIEFDAAHRVIDHESKCKYLHGHRYVLELTFDSKSLDKLGRVIDFGEIRDIMSKWINDNLDHTTILSIDDKELGENIAAITGQKIYYMNSSTTAENIANHILNDICPKLFTSQDVKCIQAKLYETPNCHVTCKNEL